MAMIQPEEWDGNGKRVLVVKFLIAIGVCLLVDVVGMVESVPDPHMNGWTVVLVLDLLVMISLVVGRVVWGARQ